MNIQELIRSLDVFPATLAAAVDGMDDDSIRYKPADGVWSILEIVCHVADEEIEDFRTRVLSTLDDPSSAWPGIDPEAAAKDRRYNAQDLAEQLDRFRRDRAESVGLLRRLKSPVWNRTYEHPVLGPIHAGDVMVSWAAHDMLHLRQIAKRRFELIGLAAPGYHTAYAGQWGA